jgi:hypothetical protein
LAASVREIRVSVVESIMKASRRNANGFGGRHRLANHREMNREFLVEMVEMVETLCPTLAPTRLDYGPTRDGINGVYLLIY